MREEGRRPQIPRKEDGGWRKGKERGGAGWSEVEHFEEVCPEGWGFAGSSSKLSPYHDKEPGSSLPFEYVLNALFSYFPACSAAHDPHLSRGRDDGRSTTFLGHTHHQEMETGRGI